MSPVDGFWLPANLHGQLLTSETDYITASSCEGRPCQAGEAGAVTARWPKFTPDQWQRLLTGLRENRRKAPQGAEYWLRFQAALSSAGRQLADPDNPLRQQALASLPGYTGYAEAMIRFTLGSLEWMTLEQFSGAFSLAPTRRAMHSWQPMPGLPGRLRFFPANPVAKAVGGLPGLSGTPIHAASTPPEMVIGFGAGNVPGAALLIAFLAQACTLGGSPLPAALIRNSRQEPIFSPLVLKALEAADADLLAATAILVWDYEDLSLQELLLEQADLVIAAASDETISQIRSQAVRSPTPPRFHAHGHKVSFSAIGREVLERGLIDPQTSQPVLDMVALLAGLDSVFWDQHGCLSSRIHFVERGGNSSHSAQEYTQKLEEQLRLLAVQLPRGAWPRQQLHDRFDRYKQLEAAGQVQVFSKYEDDFVLVLDERRLDPAAFFRTVNDCQGRVILVRPVGDLLEIPRHYLKMLPPANLQSLSVAVGRQGEALSQEFLRFSEAFGQRGVTAIRSLGRGAFPQLAYSWDGYLPLDLVKRRPEGHFTTIEFDRPFDQVLDTYHLFMENYREQPGRLP